VALECKNVVTFLSVQIVSSLTMDNFVGSKVSAMNNHLRALKKLRSALSRRVTESVGRAIVLSKLDYCNSLLYSANFGVLCRLQQLQGQLARTVEGLNRRDILKRSCSIRRSCLFSFTKNKNQKTFSGRATVASGGHLAR